MSSGYIDLPVEGGGPPPASSDGFSVIDTPNGTDPTALAPESTLILDADGGTITANADSLIITGNSGTNTVLFSVRYNNPDSGASSERFGVNSVASGLNATAVGNAATASGANGVAIGNGSLANNSASLAIGSAAQATGLSSMAIGGSSNCSGLLAMALGSSAAATNTSAFAIGIAAQATQAGSLALGNGAQSTGANAVNIGLSSTSAFASSICLGSSSAATAANQFVVGSSAAQITSAFLGRGVTATAPDANVAFNATGGSGTNITGSSLVLAGGRGTGNNATNGAVIIQTAPPGSSGTTAQTLAERANWKKSAECVFNDAGNDYDFRVEGDTEANLFLLDASTDRIGIGTATPGTRLELEQTVTISGATNDGTSAAQTFDPNYSAGSAQTVTRHNYQVMENTDGGANVTITDAAVVWFPAAAGTHKAVDSGTTKTTPATVDAWIKYNINGTIYYVPAYTSKTT